MLTYIIRRLLILIPVLVGVTLIIFSLMHVSGDPVRLMYGPNVPKEKVDEKRTELGLDKPIYVQYGNWINQLLHGDFGRSIHVQDRVSNLISARIGATLELTLSNIVQSIVTYVRNLPRSHPRLPIRFALYGCPAMILNNHLAFKACTNMTTRHKIESRK